MTRSVRRCGTVIEPLLVPPPASSAALRHLAANRRRAYIVVRRVLRLDIEPRNEAESMAAVDGQLEARMGRYRRIPRRVTGERAECVLLAPPEPRPARPVDGACRDPFGAGLDIDAHALCHADVVP